MFLIKLMFLKNKHGYFCECYNHIYVVLSDLSNQVKFLLWNCGLVLKLKDMN